MATKSPFPSVSGLFVLVFDKNVHGFLILFFFLIPNSPGSVGTLNPESYN